jgi:hypothetical protein
MSPTRHYKQCLQAYWRFKPFLFFNQMKKKSPAVLAINWLLFVINFFLYIFSDSCFYDLLPYSIKFFFFFFMWKTMWPRDFSILMMVVILLILIKLSYIFFMGILFLFEIIREYVFSIIKVCCKNKWKRVKQSHLMNEIVTDDDDADTGAWATLINPYQANYVYKK